MAAVSQLMNPMQCGSGQSKQHKGTKKNKHRQRMRLKRLQIKKLNKRKAALLETNPLENTDTSSNPKYPAELRGCVSVNTADFRSKPRYHAQLTSATADNSSQLVKELPCRDDQDGRESTASNPSDRLITMLPESRLSTNSHSNGSLTVNIGYYGVRKSTFNASKNHDNRLSVSSTTSACNGDLQISGSDALESRLVTSEPPDTDSVTPNGQCGTSQQGSACTNFAALSDPGLQSGDIPGLERYIALDCEFLGVGPKKISALGRCSVVDYDGHVVLDLYVMPDQPITDFRTPWSGIRRKDMKKAVPLQSARRTIIKAIKGKIIIGHAIFNDFKVLRYRHPAHLVRDTCGYEPLRHKAGFRTSAGVSLKRLTLQLFGRNIQGSGGHCSVEDARAALCLFKLVRFQWEEGLINVTPELPAGRQRSNSLRSSLSDSEESYMQDSFWPSDVQH